MLPFAAAKEGPRRNVMNIICVKNPTQPPSGSRLIMIPVSHKHFLLIIERKSDLQRQRYETPRFFGRTPGGKNPATA